MVVMRRMLLLVAMVLLPVGLPVAAQDPPPAPAYVLRVLHTNDTHARLEPVVQGDQSFGGVARRQTIVERIRKEGSNVLLLDAGDVFQGTLYFNQFKGQADVAMMNDIGYDAMTVGNHEFDAGPEALAAFAKQAQFPLLSANIQVTPASPLDGRIAPFTIVRRSDEQIGIFGLTPEDTPILSSPGPEITFTNRFAAAEQAVQELTARGVSKIIALTHQGFEQDVQLAQAVNGIDLIVGGHSHTPLGPMPDARHSYPTVELAPDGSQVLIVQAGEWGQWLGDIAVGFDSEGRVVSWQGQPIPLDTSVPADERIAGRLLDYGRQLDTLRATPIGNTEVALDGERAAVRTGETNLGNLVASAMLERALPLGGQVALMNGGGIRASIDRGEITLGEVLTVLPFDNTLALTTISGEQLQAALEYGVSKVNLEAPEESAGRFPQVAGLSFLWYPSAEPGARIGQVGINNGSGTYVPLDPTASYRVVTNNFLLRGGDGYDMLASNESIDTGLLLADIVSEYISTRSPLNIAIEGRILRADPVVPAQNTPPQPPDGTIEPAATAAPDATRQPRPTASASEETTAPDGTPTAASEEATTPNGTSATTSEEEDAPSEFVDPAPEVSEEDVPSDLPSEFVDPIPEISEDLPGIAPDEPFELPDNIPGISSDEPLELPEDYPELDELGDGAAGLESDVAGAAATKALTGTAALNPSDATATALAEEERNSSNLARTPRPTHTAKTAQPTRTSAAVAAVPTVGPTSENILQTNGQNMPGGAVRPSNGLPISLPVALGLGAVVLVVLGGGAFFMLRRKPAVADDLPSEDELRG